MVILKVSLYRFLTFHRLSLFIHINIVIIRLKQTMFIDDNILRPFWLTLFVRSSAREIGIEMKIITKTWTGLRH